MSARQPFRLFADFTGADPRFRAAPVPKPAGKPTPADLGFVDRCEGGHGRTSIKKSHRAEGRNFVD